MSDSNLQYVTSTTFLLFTYAKYLSVSKQVVKCGNMIVTPTQIRTFAKKQVQWLSSACIYIWLSGAEGDVRHHTDDHLINYIS